MVCCRPLAGFQYRGVVTDEEDASTVRVVPLFGGSTGLTLPQVDGFEAEVDWFKAAIRFARAGL